MRSATDTTGRSPRHRPVVVHHLADDGGGLETREAGEVHRPLGLPGAHEHAAAPRAQREDVPGARQVLGARVVAHGGEHGVRAVLGADAGGDALRRLDADGEGGAERRAVRVLLHHERELQLLHPRLVEGEADEAAPVLRHEVDGVGRDLLRGDAEVALVLAVLVVDEDDHAALLQVADGVLDALHGVVGVVHGDHAALPA
jgi:hypothetical protein